MSHVASDGICPFCEYDLTGLTSGNCPECGGYSVVAQRRIAVRQVAFCKRWRTAFWLLSLLLCVPLAALLLISMLSFFFALLIPMMLFVGEGMNAADSRATTYRRATRTAWMLLWPLQAAVWAVPLATMYVVSDFFPMYSDTARWSARLVVAAAGLVALAITLPAAWCTWLRIWRRWVARHLECAEAPFKTRRPQTDPRVSSRSAHWIFIPPAASVLMVMWSLHLGM
ncbi:MAG: hypothetical protein KF768_13380 [Phycisphaeraceae bacterium]|nr:hypothetical protein [Phycisphaeraceae bacterium]